MRTKQLNVWISEGLGDYVTRRADDQKHPMNAIIADLIKEELHSQDRTLVSGFLFTTQQQPPDPTHLWLNPCWYTPFMDDKPVAILAEEG